MADSPENTGQIQAGRFKAGQSGNPSGKPKGARNKTTLAVQELLDGEAETITRKVLELAKQGDMTAIRLVFDKLIPSRKDAPVEVEGLPVIHNAKDAVCAMSRIVEAVAGGEITPSEGHYLSGLVETYRKTLETEELERRITLLEERNGKPK
jgi:hypothetical protein